MLLTKEAKIPDDMGVIWCLTKHLRGQRILRMGNACMHTFLESSYLLCHKTNCFKHNTQAFFIS